MSSIDESETVPSTVPDLQSAVPKADKGKHGQSRTKASWLLEPDLDLGLLRYDELLRRDRMKALALRPADTPILPRKAFHSDQRKAVCEMHVENPTLKAEELASLFGTNKTTIVRTLKEKEKWLRSIQYSDVKVARNRYVFVSVSGVVCCP